MLLYGSGFRVQDGGAEVEAVCLHQAGLEVFARLADGAVRCFPLKRVLGVTPTSPVSALLRGDEVLLESSAGKLRGLLVAPPGEDVAIRLKHGQEVRAARAQVKALSLVHPMAELIAGARFEVASRSGNRYEGTVSQVLPDRRVLVKLHTGKSVELKLDRLQLDTLLVLIPIALTSAGDAPILSEALAGAPPPPPPRTPTPVRTPRPGEEGLEPLPGEEDLRQALERERRSTQVLKRKLLQLLSERDTLAKDVRERERLLESEVWRGLAAQRDLHEAQKKLESLEDDLQAGQRELDAGS